MLRHLPGLVPSYCGVVFHGLDTWQFLYWWMGLGCFKIDFKNVIVIDGYVGSVVFPEAS